MKVQTLEENIKDLFGIALFIGFIFLLCYAFNYLEHGDKWKDEKVKLKENRETLLKDYKGTNTRKRIEALKILRHDRSLWPKLIRRLEQEGNRELALAFCNLGAELGYYRGSELTSAGVDWGHKHGYRVWRSEKFGNVRYSFASSKSEE